MTFVGQKEGVSINLAPTLSLVSCNYCINKLIMPMSLSVTHFDVAALIFEAKITGWVRSAKLCLAMLQQPCASQLSLFYKKADELGQK